MSENPVFVTRSSMPTLEEYVSEIESIFDTRQLTNMGPKHNTLCEMLQSYLSVKNISLFTNGHMALEIALQSLDLSGEVITTPFTFASTPHAIVRSGLTPVFCDIRPDNYTIDAEKIESLITDKTTAIVPVHVYGNLCDTEKIQSIADKYKLKVIYDAAHAFGVRKNGDGAGSFGDISMFSFHATKVFNTVEGGALCYSNPELGVKINRLRNFGIKNSETVCEVGLNAKMNEFCAAMGICNLRHLDEEICKRKAVCDRYRERLSGIPGITLCALQDGVVPNYAYFPIVFDEELLGKSRDQIFDSLSQNNIKARKYFYPLVPDYDCYRTRYSDCNIPVARYVAERVLTLPLFADLPLSTVDEICSIICE